MADGLTVSGGGVVQVSTEEMATHSAALRAFTTAAHSAHATISGLAQMTSGRVPYRVDAPVSVVTANTAMNDAVTTLASARGQAEALAQLLELAATGYGLAEHLAQAAATQAAAQLAYRLGAIYPLLLAWFTPAALGAAGGWLIAPEERRARALEWFEAHSVALSDPRVVDLVRLTAMSADDFGAGAVHLPVELLGLLGEEGIGVLGLTAAAGAITGVARGFGLLRETPVQVSRTRTVHSTAPPGGFEDRAKRIPTGAAQIRIARYEMPDEPDRFDVYISGTREGSPVTSREPFDMTSNFAAMSMGDAGSTRAVAMAMEKAGVTADSPVQFTGHSQGAIVAVNLADSGRYNTAGIFTVGGPTGQLEVPDGVPYLALEHTEDVVPALGGYHGDGDTVLVQRSVFAGETVPDTSLLPAHELERYRESAALLDESSETRITGIAADLAEFTHGATKVTSSEWQATRG